MLEGALRFILLMFVKLIKVLQNAVVGKRLFRHMVVAILLFTKKI